MGLYDNLINVFRKTPNNLFGWVPDVPDIRDMQFSLGDMPMTATPWPPKADLTPVMATQKLPRWDQSTLGCCVWNASAGVYEFTYRKLNPGKSYMLSRLFGYYNTRVIENTVKSDTGCQIRNAFKVMNKTGICHESLWAYDIKKFAVKPSAASYNEAKKNMLTNMTKTGKVFYACLPQSDFFIEGSLNRGYPIVYGIAVYESFMSAAVAKTGIVPMPLKGEKMIGGHATFLCGYDRTNTGKKFFVGCNSWGNKWGNNGLYYIPYEYVLNPNMACDFWTIQIAP